VVLSLNKSDSKLAMRIEWSWWGTYWQTSGGRQISTKHDCLYIEIEKNSIQSL